MIDSNTLIFGSVIRAPLPFADKSVEKERPLVVISSERYQVYRPDILVAGITSKLYPVEQVGEFLIQDIHAAGLDEPSRCKAVIATISPARITAHLGQLSAEDIRSLQAMLKISLAL